LHVGGFRPAKGTATLLEALAILRAEGLEFEVEVVGEGSLQGKIADIVAELGLAGSLRFLGIMPNSELRRHFERADLLVMSSIYEAGPIVALEAGVAGVPTVGTEVGHISDMAPEAAIAVPVRDSAALADGIRELAQDDAKRLWIAAAAQAYATRIDADYTAATFKAIYRELAARSERRRGRLAQARQVGGD
jgi:glycosyltransferase involved in cell wall biosynthesis